jgi:transcription antitermination factor NusG
MTSIEAPDRRLTERWYVLNTKSRHEQVAFNGLSKKGIETFLPKTLKRSIRKDRRVMLNIPLFPGYLFLNSILTPDRHLQILKTFGAVRIIGNNDGPIPVPDTVVESLKIMTTQQTEADILIGTRFEKGEPVIVIRGPLTGVQGFFARYKGADRIIVKIDALGQFAAVEVAVDDVTSSERTFL